jgi:sugar (pentulose or hexulose) kinase
LSKKILIGVDLETSVTQAGLYDFAGRLIAEASVEIPIHYPQSIVWITKTRIIKRLLPA